MAEPSQQPVNDLVALAQARFGELSQAELKLLRAAPKGEVAFCGPRAEDDDPANDPAKADKWGHEREIRADLIRWLCKDRDAASFVDARGIRVHAARMTGALDLSFVSVPFPLGLWRCRFTEGTNLISADLPALNLTGSRVKSVTADGAKVSGDVVFRAGFRADGEVRLVGAQIGGDLNCTSGTFKNPGYSALMADRADVKGIVFLDGGFSAEGEVRLLGAQIGGDIACRGATFKNPGKDALSADGANVKGGIFLSGGLGAEGEVRLLHVQVGGMIECDGGTFNNPGKDALSADGAAVKGDVFLRGGFLAAGEVRLVGAQVGGDLDCSGGSFINPCKESLTADGADVKGNVFLSNGFKAQGEVRLLGTQIGGNLACGGGTFKNPGKHALSGDGARVEGAVFLRNGFSAEGAVRLPGAKIGGYLDCDGGRFSQVEAETAAIAGPLVWLRVKAVETATLNLTNASAGSLIDDEKSWPDKGNLFLDGFVYGQISGESPRDAKTRLRWLERQEPFTPKPYRQLAKVLRGTGDDRGARKVLFEMERRRRQVEDRRWYTRAWGWLLEWTIGYGFHPGWAFYWLLGLAALGWVLFWFGYSSGAMAPKDKDAYYSFCDHRRSPDHYPRFTASIYSLENSLPFVNLGQKDNWRPEPNPRVSGWLPGFLRLFQWSQVLAGWLLATLFVAGVTGVVRKE